MWFAKDIGDGLTTRTLYPGGSADPGATRRYSVGAGMEEAQGHRGVSFHTSTARSRGAHTGLGGREVLVASMAAILLQA